jgi:hypothetical protein
VITAETSIRLLDDLAIELIIAARSLRSSQTVSRFAPSQGGDVTNSTSAVAGSDRNAVRLLDTPGKPMEKTPGKPQAIWLLFIFFWLLFLIVFRSQPFSDPGALWHIRVGDVIFDKGFPHTDPFTWSYAGQRWIPQQWGGECLMSLLHRIGGFDALLVSMGALMAGMATWLTKRFIDGGLHWLMAVAFVLLGMAVAGFHFYLRPHLATIVLMAVVMAWIVDVDQKRSGSCRFFWLIPLCIFWTNLHGGVLGGIFTFGLAIAGWTLMKQCSRRTTALYMMIFLACLLSTLVNPFGYEMHRTWSSIVGSEMMKEYVPEHMPLNLESSDGLAVAAFGAFYIVMLAGLGPKGARIPWLIPLVWFALAWTSIRHGPLFVATALVALADFFHKTVWYRLLQKYGDTFASKPSELISSIGWKGWLIPVVALLLAFGLQRAKIPAPLIGYDWVRFDRRLVPVEMIDPLQEYAKTKPDGFPIYNDANLGGFVIYFTPSLKIFWDDRFELYGEKGFRDYIDTSQHHPERIELWAEKAPFDRALVESDSVMDKYLKGSPRWREVTRCTKAVLYERVR